MTLSLWCSKGLVFFVFFGTEAPQAECQLLTERRQTSLQSISSKLDAEIKLQLRGGRGTTCVLDFGVNCPFKHADVWFVKNILAFRFTISFIKLNHCQKLVVNIYKDNKQKLNRKQTTTQEPEAQLCEWPKN